MQRDTTGDGEAAESHVGVGLEARRGWLGSGGADLALIDADDPASCTMTYAALAELASERAAWLLRQGLRPGQLVAVPERPGRDLVQMQHALAPVGAALLPLRADADSPAVRALIEQTGAEWVWRWRDGGRGELTSAAVSGRAPAGAPPEATWSSPFALAVETSGSTGVPRAAMLTEANLRASAALSNRLLGLGPGDAWLCCLPLRHIGGLSITYRCALAGALMVLRQGFDPMAVASDLEAYGITHVSLVPPMLSRLLERGCVPPPSLRVALIGGQGLGESLARRALEGGWPIRVTYGMTETASQLATSEPLTAPPSAGRIGRPFPGMEIECPACGAAAAPLRVRGPLVMAGYANPARVPGLGLHDGWLATSDLACRDEEGCLRILGRADEVLVTGGVNVHPARVESVLANAPGVLDLAVVGASDPVWGQRLVAIYVGEVADRELDAWCRARFVGPERPRLFLSVPELPLLASGKRDRQRLRELAEAALATGA